MPTNEKEINNYLFDQLTLIERVEKALNKSEEEAREELETIRKEIERKLYQTPSLPNN